ncbi:protein preY, mitochondrial-like [Saccostrea cucullata]|uniref:protein preY, mitochondrial-like n=1 Tax=Saccostrea cuccullata TaxID=36930 RepID=UPI002ED249D7
MIFRQLFSFIGKGRRVLNTSTLQRFSTSCSVANSFDENILKILVCPLSKKPLRYDKEKNELICDDIGIAYPIINGIPNLVPQDARVIKSDAEKDNVDTTKTKE